MLGGRPFFLFIFQFVIRSTIFPKLNKLQNYAIAAWNVVD